MQGKAYVRTRKIVLFNLNIVGRYPIKFDDMHFSRSNTQN